MGRKVMRVPLDFDWPIDKPWGGYYPPEELGERPCEACDRSGYAPFAKRLHHHWWNQGSYTDLFRPEDNGSTPYTENTPELREAVRPKVERDAEYYGHGEEAVTREAARMATLYNRQWMHHLNQDDVDILATSEQWPFDRPVTAWEVNVAMMRHATLFTQLDYHHLIRVRCERAGEPFLCASCEGVGSVEAWPGQRAALDAWERVEPPEGEGWQLWQTVGDGPCSPVFASAEKLAAWLTTREGRFVANVNAMTIEQARRFVGVGWAPTGVDLGDGKGPRDGVDAVARGDIL